MKAGTRVLGVAASSRDDATHATLGGAVVRVDRAVDGFVFARATVGGLDATDAVVAAIDRLDRPDVRFCLLAGIAPAWYNCFDLPAIHEAADRPVVAVSFENSPGLAPALREAFDGEALERRLSIYERQPPREAVSVPDGEVYVRAAGADRETAARLVRATTPVGERPEPVRVARQAARAADALVARER